MAFNNSKAYHETNSPTDIKKGDGCKFIQKWNISRILIYTKVETSLEANSLKASPEVYIIAIWTSKLPACLPTNML